MRLQNISSSDFVRVTTGTARHFGFQSIEELRDRTECKECGQKVPHNASASDRRNDALHGMLTAGMCDYFDNKYNAIEGPVLFYSVNQVPRSAEPAITLQIFGVEKSVAEALLIQTIRTVLEELGHEHYSIRVNSLGDKDSVSRYIRELTNYLRKRIETMPAPARELMKEHVFIALMHLIERQHELAEKSPNPLEYLSDQSRKHFREIVEYLDMSAAPYEIDPKLIGHHECYSDALFAFDLYDENREILDHAPLYIRGGRYNAFVAKMSKKHVPAAGAVLVLRNRKALSNMPQITERAPSAYLIQLGFGPKMRSLMLLSELRRANIPVRQNIVSDSLSDQLRHAEKENMRFAVIVGQKEFIENSVILRDLHARSQETLPVDRLASVLARASL